MTRNVVRLVLASRYFLGFNKVNKHFQLRQSELALEKKWLTTDGWFRLFTTLIGINVVDTMLVLRSESHTSHPFKTMTTREFTEILAEDLVMNEFDGVLSRPKKRAAARLAAEAPPVGSRHILKAFGLRSEFGLLMEGDVDRLHQKRCSICQKKCSHYCSALQCLKCSVCSSGGKRDCYVQHLLQKGVSLESPEADFNTPLGSKRKRDSV